MRHFSKEYGEPHRRYIDPDRMAGECDDQLPLVSKVGRGPRGRGVTPRVRTDQPGEYVVEFVDDVTGEVVLSTANLSAGEISVSVDEGHSPVAGETVMATIHVRLGDATRDYSLPIPPGATGSIFFEVDGEVPPTQDGTYRVDVGRLASWGNLNRPSRPVPRVNDMVVFTTPTGFAFGTIEAVANGQVVFTSRTGFELPAFGVTDDGHLTIDGVDTGVTVVGPPGQDAVSPDLTVTREEDGVSVVATDHRGTTEAMVLDGRDGVSPTIVTSKIDGGHRLDIDSASGETMIDVMDGTDGEDGLPATMVVRSVTETQQPMVSVQRTDVQTNTFSMDFGLPRGADGKSIDIQGGVYKVIDLPDFDSTPVNRAFIVSDYEENEDYRYDLYIRGIEPVIAEEGGPWTVVEDWQGMPGFSVRYVHGIEINPDTPIQVADEDIETTFVPSAHIADGDLVIDDRMHLGVMGSATDNNGYVTVTFVTKLQIGWDDIADKPDDLVHTADLTAAIQAEADARDKADKLLETEIDGKLGPEDIVAGKNISVTNDPESDHVTIENTMKLTDLASGLIAHSDDNDFAQKPIETRIKGKTWVNRWPMIEGMRNGIMVSADETGLITISGTNDTGDDLYVSFGEPKGLAEGKQVTFISTNYGESGKWRFVLTNIGGPSAVVQKETFQVAKQLDGQVSIVITPGTTIDTKLRVMLVDGTEAPDCFTPPASIASVETGNLVTAGKNLLPVVPQKSNTVSGVTITSNGGGSYTLNGTATADIYNYKATDTGFKLPPGTYTVSGGIEGQVEIVIVKDDRWLMASSNMLDCITTTTSGNCYFYMKVNNGTTLNNVTVYPQLELGSTATPYEPPNVTQTPLPEVELRGLPNGTCDELVVKADGTCEVERVLGKITIDAEHPIAVTTFNPAAGDNLPFAIINYLFPSFASYEDALEHSMQKYVHSSTWPFVENVKSRGVYRAWNSVIFVDERFTDKETAQGIINEIGGTFVAQVPATTEPQSPVTLPALPAPTFNQYHDSPVPSETSVEYLTEDARVLTRFLMPGNIKAGSNVSVDVDGNDVTVSSSGGGTADIDTATDEEFKEYMGY